MFDSNNDFLLQVCIENGANPNIQDIVTTSYIHLQYGRSPLHMGAASGNLTAIQGLLKHLNIINLNQQTIGGETALTKSINFCKPECLSILLNAGADPNIKTAEGDDIFTLSDKVGNPQIQEIIKRYLLEKSNK